MTCDHEWAPETSLFPGRFCIHCGCDEDDLDANPRRVCPRGVTLP